MAILPLVAGCIGIYGSIGSIFSGKGSQEVDPSVYITALGHWIPVLNPLITIIVVKPYRQTFTGRKVTNSTVLFSQTLNNTDRISRNN
uniref:Uncharacterized protein n=1 Tax=Ditylenchus dipsaci TaxID=166011 RepID=A0A915DCU3_9BILA